MSNPIAQARLTAGSASAALVLLRLSYWQKKTKIRYGAHRWVVMSVPEWLAETGCTLKEFRRAVERLKRRGLVVVERHLFKQRIRSFFRLSEQAIQLLTEAPDPAQTGAMDSAQTGTTDSAQMGTIEDAQKGAIPKEPSVLVVSEKEGDISSECDLAVAMSILPDDKGLSGAEKKDDTNPPTPLANAEVTMVKSYPKSAHQVMAAVAAQKVLHKPDSGAALVALWKTEVAAETAAFVPTPTCKQVHQLKQIAQKCPKGRAKEVLTYAVRHWIEFVKTVETEAGVTKTPAGPQIGFLLKHVGVAINLALESAAASEQKLVSDLESVQLIATQKPKGAEDEYPQSYEELIAIIGIPMPKKE
ncbi:hypothetical protein V3589_11205 [Sinorhizobium fredii]|uniref:hypothetical protein n=1 Tax=Rhizobium fredii TaxID=380 RepID=UPI00309F08C2